MQTIETKLPVGDIIDIKKLSDGSWVVVQKVLEKSEETVPKSKALDCEFILVEAENLSFNDKFMQYEPRTEREVRTKQCISEAINEGVKNFYRPKYDPAFTEDGNSIYFEKGKMPAISQKYLWWEDIAQKYIPERNSRLGTKIEYSAFLGVLIKKLVEKGKSVEWAWDAVCNNSSELGHYWNSEDSKHAFELTGSRAICGFYDLGNTFKILAGDDRCALYIAGGCYCYNGSNFPLAEFGRKLYHLDDCRRGVGWIVLS